MPEPSEIVYEVNARDEIVAVNEAWDQFARENAGAGLVDGQVLGRPLWDYVSDQTTRALYRQVLERIRAGNLVRFTFRCDSPECRRLLEMTVTDAGQGRVEFRSRTLEVDPRSPQPLLAVGTAGGGVLLRVCGWCKRVDADGQWLEIEDALPVLGLMELPDPPRISHVICESCHARMVAAIEAA